MRILRVLALGLGALASQADARPVSVRGSVRPGGVYVAPHIRTSPDRTRLNNYSTQGNINPYTGRRGSKSLFPGGR